MNELRRCSPEIERELHDKEARIRELEAALHDARHFVYRCLIEEYAKGAGHNTLESLVTRMDSLLATFPPDSEPTEEAGGDDVCMCGLTYSEHTPDDDHSFTPMREHYDAAQRQDAMLERREVLEAYIEDRVQWLYNAIGTCSQHPSFMPLEEDESLRECILLNGKKAMQQVADKALSRTSDEGGETCPVCEKGTLTRIECCICDNCDAEPVLPDQIRRNDARLFSRASEPAEPSNGGKPSASAAQGDADDAAPISATPSSTPQRRDAGDALRAKLADPEAMQRVTERAAEQQDAMLERRDTLEALIHEIDLRFTSGNEVSVERARIKAHEWEQLRQALSRTSDDTMRHALKEGESNGH